MTSPAATAAENRRVLLGKIYLAAVVVVGLWFAPNALMRISDAHGWPSWRVPAGRTVGIALMLTAALVWAYCALTFVRRGRGTLYIVDPPKKLVTAGLYAHTRNPLYVAHVTFLLGLFVLFGHVAMLLYAVGILLLLHAFLVLWEEPDLRARFGDEYDRYRRTVPRWLLVRPRNAH